MPALSGQTMPRHPARWQPALRALLLPAFLAGALATVPPPAAAQAPRIVAAQSGLFDPPGDPSTRFTPSRRLPLHDGQSFGWRLQLAPSSTQGEIRVRETLTLPAEPRTFGDPEPGLRRRTTPDGRSVISEYRLQARDGWIANSWTVTRGDPPGRWRITVEVDGQPPQVFEFEAR